METLREMEIEFQRVLDLPNHAQDVNAPYEIQIMTCGMTVSLDILI